MFTQAELVTRWAVEVNGHKGRAAKKAAQKQFKTGQNFRKNRKLVNITRAALAKEAGVNATTLYYFEWGYLHEDEYPTPDFEKRLKTALQKLSQH